MYTKCKCTNLCQFECRWCNMRASRASVFAARSFNVDKKKNFYLYSLLLFRFLLFNLCRSTLTKHFVRRCVDAWFLFKILLHALQSVFLCNQNTTTNQTPLVLKTSIFFFAKTEKQFFIRQTIFSGLFSKKVIIKT